MNEYPKIDTLFERDSASFVVDPAKLKASVLATISEWDVTEKIDGTNIRVTLSRTALCRLAGVATMSRFPAISSSTLCERFGRTRSSLRCG